MSGNTTAIERLLDISNKLWDAMYESGEVPTYAERAYYYLALKDAMDENDKLRELAHDCWDFSHLMHEAMASRFYELGLIGDEEARELGLEVKQ